MRRIYEPDAYARNADPANFWRTTIDDPVCLPLTDATRAEVAIIGAGFTGLNAALRLAEAGVDVVVLDMHGPGWGASGRNGGFCCLGGAKASASALKRRFGEAEYMDYRRTEVAAIDHVAGLLDRLGIDADRHSNGETILAHRSKDMAVLRADAKIARNEYGVDTEIIEKDDLSSLGMASPEFHGGLTVRKGFGLNPRKYVLGLAAATIAAGVRIYGDSPVTGIKREEGHYVLTTPRGTVTAGRLLLATNGYSSDDLPDWMRARYLPIQSNIIVTRPLTETEIAAQGWSTDQMAYDTRHLLHYFRLMPDRRMLFGMRGGLRVTPGAQARMRLYIRAEFDRIFPAWRDVETPHFWSGLACLSRDLIPHVGPIGDWPDAWTSLAYHGNGVAMGSYCGTLLADLALGRQSSGPFPGMLRTKPPRFPLGGFRRSILPATFLWYHMVDR